MAGCFRSCTWLYFKRAVDNDQRIAAGKPLFEQEDNEKVLVWPDLVYTELIAMIVCTFVLVVWAVFLKAPLEQPATSAKAPSRIPKLISMAASGRRRRLPDLAFASNNRASICFRGGSSESSQL